MASPERFLARNGDLVRPKLEAFVRYVLGEFSMLGKDTFAMFPGRKETSGGMPPMSGASAKPIISPTLWTRA